MKKVIGSIAGAVLGASLLAGTALAATTTTTTSCSIYQTGSDSFNSCQTNSNRSAQVVCDNNVYVLNENSQDAGTGGAVVTNNTTGGNAVSGTAQNENNQTVNIGASCDTTVATPTTPTTGGQGGGMPTTTPTTPQVVAPVGSVHAGGGAGSRQVSGWAIAGLSASVAAIAVAAGSLLRKYAFSR